MSAVVNNGPLFNSKPDVQEEEPYYSCVNGVKSSNPLLVAELNEAAYLVFVVADSRRG